ncbi:MAG: ABC transporter permease [Saprospiraceae bacterium]|nr:ABC transporter permease [Saprospiraceae bacterium]
MNNRPTGPPRWALKFFRWYCQPDFVEDLEGDLFERFERNLAQVSLRKARWRFIKDTLSLFRRGIIRTPHFPAATIAYDMYRHYFKIAWRNLKKNRSFSLINLGGLAISLSCCILLILYIVSESSFDQHHEDSDHIFLVNSKAVSNNGKSEPYPKLSAPYKQALVDGFPEIEASTRLWVNFIDSKALLQVASTTGAPKLFYEPKAYHVDPNFFELFTYEFKEQLPEAQLLAKPNSIVISEQLAEKLFGAKSALQQQIKIGGTTGFDQSFEVTGVFTSEAHRSHIDAHMFLPLKAGWVGYFTQTQPQNFSSNNIFYTYVKLKENTSASQLNGKLDGFMHEYAAADLRAAGFDKTLSLLPVDQIHLHDEIDTIVSATNSRSYLYILASIGLLTLFVACVNFMNLSTAQATRRATEVSLRKTFGARKGNLIRQFLSESLVLSFGAMILGLVLVLLLLPAFNELTGKSLDLLTLLHPYILIGLFGLTIFTGIVAGSYPAFYLAIFKPFQAISDKATRSKSLVHLRRGSVVFQFVIAVGLITATLIIQRQMQYLQEKPLGFQADQQVVIPIQSAEAGKNFQTLRDELTRSAHIRGAAGTQFYPVIDNPTAVSLYRPDQQVNEIQSVSTNLVSPELMDLMEFELLAGRMFSPAFKADTANRIVVNEATLQACSIAQEQAIGQKLNFDFQGQTITYEIIGVIKDFHFEDLHQEIKPYAFLLNRDAPLSYLIAKIDGEEISSGLQELRETWNQINPATPFQYSFLKADFQQNYDADQRAAKIVSYFTLIAIVVGCLGLFGLVAFSAQRRTKEIGIRKVLGASVASISFLLSKELLLLVLMAICLALPLTWKIMTNWLASFAYHTQIDWWIFGLAALAAIFIAALTLSFHAIKAALIAPIHSLRSE